MSEEIVRFDMDMDGSMEPAEHGQWVRYEDAVLQKRKWVGLTDDEMYKLWLKADEVNDRMAFGKAVQAKLKEKNNA